jgi:hypothetical protein
VATKLKPAADRQTGGNNGQKQTEKAGIAPAVLLRVCSYETVAVAGRPGRAEPYPGFEGYFFLAFLAFFAFFAFFAFLAIVSSQGLMD